MLLRFTSIKNVGRFHDCHPGGRHFGKKTIIFGGNGNGKSTKTDILNSASTGNAKLVKSRKTFGSTDGQVVEMVFDEAGVNKTVKYENGAWSAPVPNLVVFDSRFVSQNIFDGDRLSDEHRSNLHRIIVGAEGRKLAEAIGASGRDIRAKEQEVNVKEREFKITEHAKVLTLDAFIALPQDVEIDKKIAELEAQKEFIAIARNPELKKLSEGIPAGVEENLSRGSAIAHEQAKKDIEGHVAVHWQDQSHRKEFLSEGLVLAKDEHCPFCGQDLGPVSGLIEAYRAFFDAKYKQWETEIRSSLREIRGWNVDAAIKDLESGVAGWKKFLPSECGEISSWIAVNGDVLRQAKADLEKECERKSLNVEHQMDFSSLKKIETLLVDLDIKIGVVNSAAGTYKKNAESKDARTIESDLLKQRAVKSRHEPVWVSFCAEHAKLTTDLLRLKSEREANITKLNTYSAGVFASHQNKINEILEKLGADFRIEELEEKTDRRKVGGVHCGFKLVFFGSHSVVTEDGEDGYRINNTLSHGDKNLLALAFFVATLWNDPELDRKIIVVDDPVSSLDYDRKCATVGLFTDLRNEAGLEPKQLIILTHDRPLLKEIGKHPWFSDGKYLQLVNAGKTLDGRKKSDMEDMNITDFLMSEDMKRQERIKHIAEDNDPIPPSALDDCRPILESLMKQKYWNELKQVIAERGSLGTFVDKLEELGIYDGSRAAEFRALAPKLHDPHHASPESQSQPSDGDIRHTAKETLRLAKLV